MTYYSVLISGESNMFFWKRKRAAADAKREAEIHVIQQDTQKKIKKASESVSKAAREIDKFIGDDVAQNLFYATGGDRRQKNVRR